MKREQLIEPMAAVAAEEPELVTAPGAQRDAVRVVSGAPERFRRIGRWMAVTDAICMATALILSFLFRYGSLDMPMGYLAVVGIAPFVWVGTYRLYSLHRPQLLSSWEEFRRTISASSVGMVAVIMGSFWTQASLPRLWVGATWALVLFFELASRRAWRKHVGKLQEQGRLALRTLIVAAGNEHKRIEEALSVQGSGFTPVGLVSTDGGTSPDVLPVVASLDDLVEGIYDYGVDCLFVDPTGLEERQMLTIIKLARQQDVEVHVAANLPEILSPRLTVQPLQGIMALSLRPVRLSGTQALVKRAFDLAISVPLSILLLPLYAAVGIAIKLASPGPVLFKQYRVTKGGHVFSMYKFRTMSSDAERFVVENEIDTSTPFFKMGDDDPRLTKVGARLRRWSIDELPQLINVIRGEMSLVGPRPLPADQVAANLELLGPRHEVPAGMSGWWQVQGRSDVDADEAIRLDLFYIENWSLALDIYVLLKTLGAVVARKGAY